MLKDFTIYVIPLWLASSVFANGKENMLNIESTVSKPNGKAQRVSARASEVEPQRSKKLDLSCMANHGPEWIVDEIGQEGVTNPFFSDGIDISIDISSKTAEATNFPGAEVVIYNMSYELRSSYLISPKGRKYSHIILINRRSLEAIDAYQKEDGVIWGMHRYDCKRTTMEVSQRPVI